MAHGSCCSGFNPEAAGLDGLGAAHWKVDVSCGLLVKTMPVSHLSPRELQAVSNRTVSGTFSLAEKPGVRLDVNNKLLFLVNIPINV